MRNKINAKVTIGNVKIYLDHIKQKTLDLSSEPRWNILFREHLLQSFKLYSLAVKEKDERFYRDCINRANKVFEGVINLLFDAARKVDSSVENRDTLYLKTEELLRHQKIANIFRRKLDEYRQDTRNPETHEVFEKFNVKHAKIALNEALIFMSVGLENFQIIEAKVDPIDDRHYLYIIIYTFVECFAIYSQFFSLYEELPKGIYSAKIKELTKLIQEYHKNSIFSREFRIEKHEGKNKLKPHFKITLANSSLTLTIIKITEIDMIFFSSMLRIIQKLKNYSSTFENLFFLVWSFTNRSRLGWTLSLFDEFHHYHLYGLKRVNYKKITDFLNK
ncbi:MAG: hypothetical protein JW891_13690 [Candidatus Lokiarchaeota archaeon]|nr:hypothetical protein [Candidatus Lokiarchaeota archaeon]